MPHSRPRALDPYFGTNGITTIDFGGTTDAGHAVVVQADGKIVVGGSASSNFALARLDEYGVLDTTFKCTGKATKDLGSSPDAIWVFPHEVLRGREP